MNKTNRAERGKKSVEESRPPGLRAKCSGLGLNLGHHLDEAKQKPGSSETIADWDGEVGRDAARRRAAGPWKAAKRRRWNGAGSEARFRLGGVRQRLTGRAAKNCLVEAGLPGLGPNFHSEGKDRLRGSERSLLPSVRLASPGPPTEDHPLSLLSRKNGLEESQNSKCCTGRGGYAYVQTE